MLEFIGFVCEWAFYGAEILAALVCVGMTVIALLRALLELFTWGVKQG